MKQQKQSFWVPKFSILSQQKGTFWVPFKHEVFK